MIAIIKGKIAAKILPTPNPLMEENIIKNIDL